MLKIVTRFFDWLERHWVKPAYSGGVLLGIAICFFGAATNTMAGWLYAISGIIFALLGLGAVLAARSLSAIQVRRRIIAPISAGDELVLELELENTSDRPRSLLQVYDALPSVLGKAKPTAIETLSPQQTHRITYYHPTERRGVYRWQDVELKTATPLGLFWAIRNRSVPAKAIVYPQVLPLRSCPLVDTIGREESFQTERDRRYQSASEGITKSLRPYRMGDPTRLIHWRTSAKFGNLQVRELEVITSGKEVIICLDSGAPWDSEAFERAVITAASLYFYASRCLFSVQLWTAKTGTVQGNRVVLETLAATYIQEEQNSNPPMDPPLVWLSANANSINALPRGSCYLLFGDGTQTTVSSHPNLKGLAIAPDQPLQDQLQRQVRQGQSVG
ncbi:MAG: DUF58 domain-containing protein [Cyanobacteria bacterium P01_E01_bin.42]